MREPKQTKVKKNARYPNGVKYTGAVAHRGQQRWVPGSYGTKGAWQEKAREIIKQIDSELDGPGRPAMRTVGEFAGVTVREDNRIVPRDGVRRIWPWTHLRSHSGPGEIKEASAERHAEALRPFIRLYENRALDSFTRSEAEMIVLDGLVGPHTVEALQRFWVDAASSEILSPGSNIWVKLTSKRPPRISQPDFRIITAEELERLYEATLKAHADDYRFVIRTAVVLESELGIRPSELWGIEHECIDWKRDRVWLRYQVDTKGRIRELKNKEQRWAPLFPASRLALANCPRLHDRFALATPHGTPLTNSRWHTHWNAARVGAGLPAMKFYELKHRAITFMATPTHWERRELGNRGGLGLDLPTVAKIVGHTDPTGAVIAKHYLHLDQELAVDRALKAYHEQAAASADGPTALRVVGE